MQNKKWIIALVLGLIAAILHYCYIQGLNKEITGGKRVKVAAMAQDLDLGQTLERQHIAIREIPVSYVDDRVVKADRIDEIVGLPSLLDLRSGQTILWSDFALRKGSEVNDLSELIKSGKRAMTIRVNSALSLGGLLRPGHRVDILGTFNKSGMRGNSSTLVLLQNTKVLAIGSRLTGDSNDKEKRFSTVTLSVSIEEAELLSLATEQGSLSLALRGHQDLAVIGNIPEMGMADIWEADRRDAILKPKVKTGDPIERLRPR